MILRYTPSQPAAIIQAAGQGAGKLVKQNTEAAMLAADMGNDNTKEASKVATDAKIGKMFDPVQRKEDVAQSCFCAGKNILKIFANDVDDKPGQKPNDMKAEMVFQDPNYAHLSPTGPRQGHPEFPPTSLNYYRPFQEPTPRPPHAQTPAGQMPLPKPPNMQQKLSKLPVLAPTKQQANAQPDPRASVMHGAVLPGLSPPAIPGTGRPGLLPPAMPGTGRPGLSPPAMPGMPQMPPGYGGFLGY